MAIITTFELPNYTKYELNDEIREDGTLVAKQIYTNEDRVVVEVELFFTKDTAQNNRKCPYKIIVKDIEHKINFKTETE